MAFKKDPDAKLDYAIDWTAWLDDDAIDVSEWIVPDELTKEDEDATTTRGIIWLSGGEVGQELRVTNRITTAGGRIDDRSFTLQIEER
jgi:hypothetical protein